MKTVIPSKRDHSLDLARIAAACLVVGIHVAIFQWFSLDVFDPQWKILNFYNTAAKGAVPLFFLISGNLFLGRTQMPSLKTLLCRYILRLAVVYLLWNLLYAVDTAGVRAILSFDIRNILHIFLFTPKYHLWYLPAMISVYLLLPVLWCIAKYDNGKYLGYACIVFFLCCVKTFLDSVINPGNTPNFMHYLTYELCGYSGYFLLGHYLSKKAVSFRPRCLIAGYLLTTLIGAGLGLYLSLKQGSPNSSMFDYLSLIPCLQAILLYLAFLRWNPQLSARSADFIVALSKCTLFTYLVHPFVLEHLNDLYELMSETLMPAVAVPAMTILVQILCFVIALILLRIPLLKKLVVI